jgi:ribose transport system permease protein
MGEGRGEGRPSTNFSRMTSTRQRLLLPVLNHTTLILFVVVLAVFGALSPKFFTVANLTNLLVQSSSVAIVGVGMTFVLLTAGVDLSVGAIMFVAAAVAGKLVLGGASLPVALLAILAVGIVYGAFNALLVTRLRIIAFIATLGTLYIGRGLGLWITQTRAMNLPDSLLAIGSAEWLGVPLPLWISAVVLVVAHVTLTRTPFGRQLYAVGNNLEAAKKAGLNTRRLLASVYVISGLCAAIGGILSLAQLGAVSPTFGTNREFSAIAAAVLGGTSLFGGRGAVFPGTVLGAVLIQSVENGLVILNADPYLYPLVTSAIIFVAVLADASRNFWLERLGRRRIYHQRA